MPRRIKPTGGIVHTIESIRNEGWDTKSIGKNKMSTIDISIRSQENVGCISHPMEGVSKTHIAIQDHKIWSQIWSQNHWLLDDVVPKGEGVGE